MIVLSSNLSLRGSDTHCCSLCISSILTLSYQDILTHFISFPIASSPHFVYLLFPGNGFLAYSSLSFSISQLLSASFSVCASLSLSVSPLIGYCELLSWLHCYGLCKRHYYESGIFLRNVCLRTKRETQGNPVILEVMFTEDLGW